MAPPPPGPNTVQASVPLETVPKGTTFRETLCPITPSVIPNASVMKKNRTHLEKLRAIRNNLHGQSFQIHKTEITVAGL
jgi:hypothetical protein